MENYFIDALVREGRGGGERGRRVAKVYYRTFTQCGIICSAQLTSFTSSLYGKVATFTYLPDSFKIFLRGQNSLLKMRIAFGRPCRKMKFCRRTGLLSLFSRRGQGTPLTGNAWWKDKKYATSSFKCFNWKIMLETLYYHDIRLCFI